MPQQPTSPLSRRIANKLARRILISSEKLDYEEAKEFFSDESLDERLVNGIYVPDHGCWRCGEGYGSEFVADRIIGYNFAPSKEHPKSSIAREINVGQYWIANHEVYRGRDDDKHYFDIRKGWIDAFGNQSSVQPITLEFETRRT